MQEKSHLTSILENSKDYSHLEAAKKEQEHFKRTIASQKGEKKLKSNWISKTKMKTMTWQLKTMMMKKKTIMMIMKKMTMTMKNIMMICDYKYILTYNFQQIIN